MPLTHAAKNIGLDAIAAVIGFISLHDGDPSTTGANELSGGTPAYARKAATWDAAASGSVAIGDAVGPFDVPAGTSVQYVGFWSAATGGTFYGSDQVTTEVFGSQGTYTLTAGTVALT